MIYFVEGAPAVGKSFYSRRLKEKLEDKKEVIYYKEEYKNPIDLLRQAVLTQTEYANFLHQLRSICTDESFKMIERDIINSSTDIDNMVVIPFMHIKTYSEEQRMCLDSLYEKEMDDGKSLYNDYCEMLIKRTQKFLEEYEPEKDYIFEGAILHNPLFSILGFYNVSERELINFYKEIETLLSSVEYEFHVVCCNSINNAIEHAIASRKAQDSFGWQEGFDRWFCQSVNCKSFHGKEGIVLFSEEIACYERIILENVFPKYIKIKREV